MSADEHLQQLPVDPTEQPEATAEPATRSGAGLGDLLGAVLSGGGSSEPAGGGSLAGLLAALAGGGAGRELGESAGLGGLLGSVATPLVERLVSGLGLEPQTAQGAVAFLLDRLLGARRAPVTPAETGATPNRPEDGLGFSAITLTTLSHVPWNAPFYERLGFHILGPGEMPTALSDLLASEIERGLPGQNRVAMRRELQAGRGAGWE